MELRLYTWDRAELALYTDFDDLYIVWRVTAQGSYYGGRDETAPHLGVKSHQKTIWGLNRRFKPSREINKLARFRNYFIDATRILHSDKDH